jgi:predicted nucleic-acid-binding protein
MLAWRKRRGGMLSIDTNIIVRALLGDNPVQSDQARALIRANRVWVSTTVLLEVEWVLRSAYKLPKSDVIANLTDFVGLANVTLQEHERVATALGWAAKGMDFADALHLAATQSSDSFVTFDQQLVTKAKGMGAGAVQLL